MKQLPNIDSKSFCYPWKNPLLAPTAGRNLFDSHVCANGYGRFCDLWVWCRRSSRWPCCLPMSNPSTFLWITRSHGSGWRDNRLAAQHLPRDLVRPSSERTGSNDDDEPACAYVAYCRYCHLNQPRRAGFYVLNKLIVKT